MTLAIPLHKKINFCFCTCFKFSLKQTSFFISITTSSASTGVKLPPTEAGAMVGIRNDSGQTISVYPYNTSSTINAAAASVTLATAKSMILFAPSATTWASVTSA